MNEQHDFKPLVFKEISHIEDYNTALIMVAYSLLKDYIELQKESGFGVEEGYLEVYSIWEEEAKKAKLDPDGDGEIDFIHGEAIDNLREGVIRLLEPDLFNGFWI